MYLTCHINSEIIHGINSTHEMKVLRKKNMLQLTAVSVQQYNKLPHSDH